jgi:branched-chain amino acid transport system substrate-binding protein
MARKLHFNHRMQIGISIAQTGPLSTMGIQALRGIRLWISQLESKGGLCIGRRPHDVQLITRDDSSRISLTRDNMTTLINQGDVDVLLGPYSSHLTKAAGEICEHRHKLLWNHGGASDEIFRRKPRWNVSTISPASRYFQKLPGWIAKNGSGFDKYLLLSSSKGTFASNVAAGFRESIDPPANPVRLHSADLPERADVFIQLLKDVAPQLLVLAGSFENEVALLRTRPLWPDSVQYVACVSAGINQFFTSLGHLSEGVIGPSQWEPQVNHVLAIGPTSVEFVKDFNQSFSAMPDYIAAGAFAAGLILEECLRRAASFDDRRLREITHELKTETFYGRFQIDEFGRQVGHAMHLVRWRNGKKQIITE